MAAVEGGKLHIFHANISSGFTVVLLHIKDNFFFIVVDKNSCFFGKCYYCKGPEDGVCGAGEMLEGVVTLWLPKSATMTTLPHPWRRSYTTQAKKLVFNSYRKYIQY